MSSWYSYLKRGLSRKLPKDGISGKQGYPVLKTGLDNLRPFLHRHWRKGALGGGLLLVTVLLSFPQPLIIRHLIDEVILGSRPDRLATVILLLVGISLAAKLSTLLEEYYFARFEQQVLVDIQQDLFSHVLRLPKAFFDAQDTGYLMSRLASDVSGLRWFFSSAIVQMASNFLQFLGGVGLLFYLEWRLAAVVLLVLPAAVLVIRYFSLKMYTLGHQSMEQHAHVLSRFQESLSSLPLIKAFSSEDRTRDDVMAEVNRSANLFMEQSVVGSIAGMMIGSMPGIAKILVLATGAYWVIRGDWTLGSLLAFQSYLGYVFGPARYLAMANLQMQNARASLERVSALFDIVPEENLGVGKSVDRLEGELEFRNISFAYDSSSPVLNDVSFKAPAGSHVAIVGPSGVGKTTLLSLILRFYRPNAGEIFFDGLPASDYNLSALRRRIGYVSQSAQLLSGSIGENLRYGNPEAGEEEVLQAARVAELHDFIVGLPAGYDTHIGEKGVKLSEGQQQRLAIARALIKKPDIVILDEPTAALDSLTEKSLFNSLPSLLREKTLFVVAHRLSTVKNSDCILLLDESRLVATGTHESLLATNDYYRSLVAAQLPG